MYGAGDVQPAIRSEKERQEAHPVFAAYMDMRYSRNMARDEARENAVSHLVRRFFNGSHGSLAMNLLEKKRIEKKLQPRG